MTTHRDAPVTRDLVARSLHLRADSIDEKARSVEAVLATESRALVFDFQRFDVIEEILLARGAELPTQVPLLETHNRFSLDAVFGSVRELKIQGSQVTGRLFFAEGDERVDSAWNKVRQGHLTDVSAGYRAIEFVDIKPNTSARVAGTTYTAGERTLRITTRWKPREISLVAIGADEAAKIREDVRHPRQLENIPMNKHLREYLESLGLKRDATDEGAVNFMQLLEGEQRTRADSLRAGESGPPNEEKTPAPPPPAQQRGDKPPAPAAPSPPAVDVSAERQAGALTERKRIADLQELAADDVAPELVTRAIGEGWDTTRASGEFLKHIRDTRSPALGHGNAPAGHVRDHDVDCTERALCAGALLRCGLPAIDENASPQLKQTQERAAEMGYQYRDMSMIDMCREAIRLSGQRLPHTREEQIRAAVSTGALSSIFSTVVNVQLMQSYLETEDSTVGWVRETDVPDFKTNTRVLLGRSADLKHLPRGATADHTTRGAVQEEYKVFSYANQFRIDRQDIIDDRMNALQTMPMEMGAAARRLRPELVYYILLANAALGADSVALFHTATHGNLGTGNALTASTLQVGLTAMAKQRQDGKNLNLQAKFLLVPQDLQFTAAILLKSAERVISASSGGTFNPLINLNIDLRSDNRLGVAGVTDPITGTAQVGTATNWFLIASPSQAPTVEVGYLAGTGRVPLIRSFTLDKGAYGIGWDIVFDIGAKALDFRGMFKATGV